MSSTGSPDPTTSYSSSTPLTFAISMSSSSGLPRWLGVSWSPPEMREQDCYGGNSHGYGRRRLIPSPIGHGSGGVR